MKVRFHPGARAELLETIRYYERQVPQLGAQFLAELRAVLARVEGRPASAPVVRGEFRRIALRRFPYGVIYRVVGEELRIAAIAHRRRRPGYWRSRQA